MILLFTLSSCLDWSPLKLIEGGGPDYPLVAWAPGAVTTCHGPNLELVRDGRMIHWVGSSLFIDLYNMSTHMSTINFDKKIGVMQVPWTRINGPYAYQITEKTNCPNRLIPAGWIPISAARPCQCLPYRYPRASDLSLKSCFASIRWRPVFFLHISIALGDQAWPVFYLCVLHYDVSLHCASILI